MEEPHVYPEGCCFKSLSDIDGKKITIMGLGLNGGGEACVRFFSRYGAYVTVTDMKSEEELAPTLEKLRSDSFLDLSRTRFVLGRHELSDFQEADCVIKNPGVKFEGNKFLAAARAVESDISVFLNFTKAPVIAVSGSKGKSSTVSAIHYGLCQAGFKAFLGGNITVSPLTFLEQTDENTPVVLELSSWQLRDLRGRNLLKPKVSVLTKIIPDHQNWYHAMEPYVADKKLIYADQTAADYTLCNADDGWGKVFAEETEAKVIWYGDSVEMPVKVTEAAVPGIHMKQNLSNAAIVLTLMGVEKEKAVKILSAFPGIEHRLEYFHSWTRPGSGAEFRFYNDTTATVPDAAAAALEAFEDKPVLFAGGNDKELDFTPFAEAAHKAAAIYFLEGKGTDRMLPLLQEKNIGYHGPYSSLDALLEDFRKDADSGLHDSGKKRVNVVFSPGATSFGMFTNEFDRGRKFKEKVSASF